MLFSKTFKPQVKQRVYAQKEVSKDATDSGLVASSSASVDMDTSTSVCMCVRVCVCVYCTRGLLYIK